MRFDEHLRRVCALATMMLAASGCAMLPPLRPASEPVKVAAATEADKPTPTPEKTVAASGAPAATVNVEPTVAPAAQRTFEQARSALAAGRLDEAEQTLVQLTQAHPQFGAAHAHLGVIYRKAGKARQAVVQLEKAATLSPRNAAIFNELGIAQREAGQFEKARQAYEQAIALDAAYAAAHLNLGILLDIYLWDGAAALAAYERYLALAGADEKVGKWVADLRNRGARQAMASRKEAR